MARNDVPLCRVYRSGPDHTRAICDCGWESAAHLFLGLAKRNARLPCAKSGCRLADGLLSSIGSCRDRLPKTLCAPTIP